VRHAVGGDSLQFEVAANRAVGVEQMTKWHGARVKTRFAGFATPRQDARETQEMVVHRPALGTPAVRSMTNRAAYRLDPDLFSPARA